MPSRLATDTDVITQRSRFFVSIFSIIILIIIIRLFYWQVVQSKSLQAAAEEQYQKEVLNQGKRGTIFTSDGSVLVTNEKMYRLFAQPNIISESDKTAIELSKIVGEYEKSVPLGLDTPTLYSQFLSKLSQKEKKWISLKDNVPESVKLAIQEKKLTGIGFDEYFKRSYPEASMAAHITGFVGKNEKGQDTGYFGLEGALEKELQAQQQNNLVSTDALGQQLLQTPKNSGQSLNGRDIFTTIRRDMQFLAESALKKGIEQYGAKAGEVIIMDPKTGAIRALASYPSYNPEYFYSSPAENYKNPSLATVYEPGSTFKVLTVAAGIEEQKINPDTQCPSCAGPRVFGKYTIRTWNDKYYPNTTMTEALAHSDNTAMIFIAEQLGANTFSQYLKDFGIGEELHLELQEDTTTPFPSKWGPVELATTSFGQGVSTNSLQLVRAIGSIANKGVMMRPRIVEAVRDGSGKKVEMQPIEERQVVSEQTASTVTNMMIKAVDSGEAQWVKSINHTVAGKTGTSQIAVNGSYDPDKTIASFIGFAPADDPEFIMLVKLVEPQSSIWAAETAAPLWYSIANRLFVMLQIPPDR